MSSLCLRDSCILRLTWIQTTQVGAFVGEGRDELPATFPARNARTNWRLWTCTSLNNSSNHIFPISIDREVRWVMGVRMCFTNEGVCSRFKSDPEDWLLNWISATGWTVQSKSCDIVHKRKSRNLELAFLFLAPQFPPLPSTYFKIKLWAILNQKLVLN